MLLFMSFLAFVIMILFSFVLIGGYASERDEMALRLKSLEGKNVEVGTVIEEEMSVSFKNRIVTPFFDSLSRFFAKFFPSTTISSLDKKLLNANGFYGLNAEQFLGLSLVIGVILAVFV